MERAETLGSDTMDSPRVRLLTYFRSKGQQFGTVILPTLNEGKVPDRRAPEEDERRLFYVGVTRATRNLWLSYVDEISGFPVLPSKFLAELQLPPEGVRHGPGRAGPRPLACPGPPLARVPTTA
jgi:superfamily I DNA/RNA helicase